MSAEKSKPRALVIGGSLGGLMAGIESLHAGCDVEIFERSPRALDDRGAGIVMQSETLHMLTHRCGLAEDETGVRLRQRQYLGHDDGKGRIRFLSGHRDRRTTSASRIVQSDRKPPLRPSKNIRVTRSLLPLTSP
jgi:2-polyprenyl-6-methoxyphenol hydroxylase-like FAD-dependent oxidoreductase